MTDQATLPLEVPGGVAPAPAAAPKPEAKKAPTRFVLPDDPAPVAKPVAAPAPEPEAKPESTEATPEQAEKPDPEAERRREKNRLERAYRKRAEALARAEVLEKELAAERAKSTPKADDGAPKLEQFDYDPEKYAAAKEAYGKKQAEKEITEKQRTAEQTKQREKLVSSWEEKAEKARGKFDDFDEVVGELQPTNRLVAAIMKSEPDVAHYLGKHPKEAEKIAALDEVDQILAIGRLEAKLLSEPVKPKALSKAPEPVKPLSGAGSPASDVPSDADDTATWIKKRQRQVHRRNV